MKKNFLVWGIIIKTIYRTVILVTSIMTFVVLAFGVMKRIKRID